MKKTFIPLTLNCNDNCISCPVPRRKNRKNPPFENIKKEIDKILSYSNHIELNGGEPTLRKDLFRIIKYIKIKKPNKVTLLTNAQCFYYMDYAKKISKINNLKIITTLYGHNSELHDAVTRTPGSFKHKITGIKNLIKCKVPIELRILLHKMNYKYFDEIVDFLLTTFNKQDFTKIVILNPKLTEQARKHKDVVAEKLNKISKVLEKPIKKLQDNDYKISLYHFPHCILPKTLWKYSSGVTVDDPEVLFVENCRTCLKKQECSKIWGSYLDIFGSNEFKPIKEK